MSSPMSRRGFGRAGQSMSGTTSGTRGGGPSRRGSASARSRWMSPAVNACSGPKCSIQRFSHSCPITHAPGSPGRHHQRGAIRAVWPSARHRPTCTGPVYPGSFSLTRWAISLGNGSSSQIGWPAQRPYGERAGLAEDHERDSMTVHQHVALDIPPVGRQRRERLGHARLGDREPLSALQKAGQRLERLGRVARTRNSRRRRVRVRRPAGGRAAGVGHCGRRLVCGGLRRGRCRGRAGGFQSGGRGRIGTVARPARRAAVASAEGAPGLAREPSCRS